MKLRQILHLAFDQQLLHEPQPCSLTMILADDDGCVVSCGISHQVLHDWPEYTEEILKQLMAKRSELRTDA
jgi:hypothetical protein